MILQTNTTDKNILSAAADVSTHSAPERLQASLSVIFAPTGRVVVTHRAKDDQLGLPCGKHDAGESPVETAYRELEEETGIRKQDLLQGLAFVQQINFDGCLISVFCGKTARELPVGPLPAFAKEGPASWMDPQEVIATRSRFQNFNIVCLFNCNLI